MQVRLIALDVDGTLLDSERRVPPANARAIAEAARRGMEVVLVTGRRFDFALDAAEQIPLDLVMIASNGALVRTRSGRTHARRLLPRAAAAGVLQATRRWRSRAALIFDRPREGQMVCENAQPGDEPRRSYYARNREFISEAAPLEGALTEDPLEVMFAGRVLEMRDLLSCLGPLARRTPFETAVTEYEARDFTIVDVLQEGCTKGAALRAWAEYRGISREEVMAVGDNWNDCEMLEFAGLPVVMGNSPEELKLRGWRVTLANDECGVANAIREYAFRETR